MPVPGLRVSRAAGCDAGETLDTETTAPNFSTQLMHKALDREARRFCIVSPFRL